MAGLRENEETEEEKYRWNLVHMALQLELEEIDQPKTTPEEERYNRVKTAIEFDPLITLKAMIHNREAYMDSQPAKLEYDISNYKKDCKVSPTTIDENRVSWNTRVMVDLNFLIMVYQTMGSRSHISEIRKKSNKGIADILALLKVKYDICDHVHASGTRVSSEVITLPRIAACFPSVSVRLFHLDKVRCIVPFGSFPHTTESLLCSKAICCPLLISTCPKTLITKEGENIHPLMFWLAVKVDDVTHRKEKTYTGMLELFQYYKASFHSTAVPEPSRITVFNNLDFLNADKSGFKVVIKELASKCSAELDNLRTDGDKDAVLQAIRAGNMD